MLVCCDIDGTLDADPVHMASLLTALRAAGHRVVILTGTSTADPTEVELDEKEHLLKSLGMGSAWDTLVVIPEPTAKGKATWVRDNHCDLLIDNDLDNARRAARYCTVLVPFNSMSPSDAKEAS